MEQQTLTLNRVRRLLAFLGPRGAAKTNMNMATAIIFLTVAEADQQREAERGGISTSVTQMVLCELLDIPVTTVSRIVIGLSDDTKLEGYTEEGDLKAVKSGLGLLTQHYQGTAADWRRKPITLTEKGKALMAKIEAILNDTEEEGGEIIDDNGTITARKGKQAP